MRHLVNTRLSPDERATSAYSSLRRQEEACRNYVDIHREKGWRVAVPYKQPGD